MNAPVNYFRKYFFINIRNRNFYKMPVIVVECWKMLPKVLLLIDVKCFAYAIICISHINIKYRPR